MNASENIQQFYQRIAHHTEEEVTALKPHINIFDRASCKGAAPYSRRDYYKVTLVRGKGLLEYADKAFEVDRPAVLFSTPKVPYRWVPAAGEQLGWFCIFNEPFANEQNELVTKLPMFQVGTDKLFYPDRETENEIAFFFEKMMTENAANYQHKQDVLRNYLHLIIHQVLKMQPAHHLQYHHNASERITALFLELLERQFPIDANFNVLELRSAKDFAAQLSVHTNHLNRAVKEVTGETTSHHISKRIISEANDMLRHTNWQIAEIAFALGFEEPAYFNTFYKKNTGFTPKEIRNVKMVL